MARRKDKPKQKTIIGRVAQVDLCAEGLVLSVGPASLWLGSATARDVVETLARALVIEAEQADADEVATRNEAAN